MTLLDHAKQFAGGAAEIRDWLGDGGEVVTYEEAQGRANLCLTCAKNVPAGMLKGAIADATRKRLEIKNKVGLRTAGEKRLGKCEPCGCVLRLLVWEPQRRIQPYLTAEEKQSYPAFCWKLKEP